MKNIFLFLLTSSIAYAEPIELTNTRNTYNQKQDELTKTYANWLTNKVSKTVGEDQKAYIQELRKLNYFDKKEPLEIGNDFDGKNVIIDARTGVYKIGRLKEGDVVEIQYISGLWHAYPGWTKESPDDAKIDQHKLYFVLDGRNGNTNITQISNTIDEPFKYEIIVKGEYSLRMGDPQLDANDGFVKYKIRVIKN